ncbi:MAG: hypothetical protein ABW186_07060 [Rhodanobacteraceae bacterium]
MAAIPAIRYGIRLFCVDSAGAQCGLGGVFGTGPLVFGIAALTYAAAYAIRDLEQRGARRPRRVAGIC